MNYHRDLCGSTYLAPTARILMLGLALAGSLQAQSTTGTILGTVKDPTEAVVAGATVTAIQVETGVTRTTASGSRGEYRLPALAVGTYEVQAEMAGFQTSVRKGITLSVGRDAVVDITLKVGDVAERVTVTGEAPIIETTTATVSGLVDPKQMRDIPLNARSFIELVPLQTGAVFAESGESSATKGFGRKLAIVGQRYTSNSFLLDGADINDAAGASGSAAQTMAGVETVREFRVVTNAYDAEYGRHTGGVISAITKSGTNELHGSLFEFLRNDHLDAPRWEDNAFAGGDKPAYKRNQFGFSVGGPVRKDKTFFFGSLEELRERLGQTSVNTVPSLDMRRGIVRGQNIGVNPVIRPFLDAYPVPNLQDLGDGRAYYSVASTKATTQNYWMAKIDHRFSDSDSVFARFTMDNAEQNEPRANGFNTSEVSGTASRYSTVEETHIFSPQLLARTHFSLNRTNITLKDIGLPGFAFPKFSFTDEDTVPGIITITGLTAWGGSSTSPKIDIQNTFQFKEDFFYTQGRHSMKFGGQFERFQFNERSDFYPAGSFGFATVEDFLRGIPSTSNFTRPGSDDIRGWRQNLIGLYLQDDVSLRPGLTLNIGLRYEFITVPHEVNGKVATVRDLRPEHLYTMTDRQTDVGDPYFLNPSLKNFVPRVGLAWAPFKSHKTSVRAGFGIFPDQVLTSNYINPGVRMAPFYSAAGLLQQNIAIDFPNAYVTQRAALIANIGSKPQADALQWRISQPNVYKWSFDLEQQVGADISVQAGYSGTRGTHLFRGSLMMNATPSEFRPYTDGSMRRFILIEQPFPNPNWDRMRWRVSDGTSDYHALRLSMTKRFSRGFQLQSSYTFSKSTDDTSTWSGSTDYGEGDRRGYMLTKDHALSAFDVRNSFFTNLVYELPGRNRTGVAGAVVGGWSLSSILRFNSGSPINISADLPRLTRSGRTFQEVYVDGPSLDVIPGGSTNPVRPRNPDQYFDVKQFAYPATCLTAACNPAGGFQGNLGRNTIINPGVANVDFTLMKDTKLSVLGENTAVEFRAEFFNLLNRSNFGTPSRSVFDRNGVLKVTAGQITSTRIASRQIQFGLKLIF